MEKLRIKNGNRILCAATAVMVIVQFFLVFIGIYDTLLLLVATHGAMLLVILLGLRLSKVDIKAKFRFEPISFKTFTLAFATILCCFPIVSLLNILSMFFVENAVVDTATDIYHYGLWVSLIVLAVMPSITEELLIRGVIYHSYREKSPILAWFASALIFGLLHMNFNQMPYAIFLGMMMVLMMEASGSIVTSICMHFFLNGISTWSGFMSQMTADASVKTEVTIEGMIGSGDVLRTTLVMMAVLCIMMIPLLCLLVRGMCRENERKLSCAFAKPEAECDYHALPEVQDEEKIVDVWLILAVLIMVVITGLNTFA